MATKTDYDVPCNLEAVRSPSQLQKSLISDNLIWGRAEPARDATQTAKNAAVAVKQTGWVVCGPNRLRPIQTNL